MKGNLKKVLAGFFVLAMVAAPLYGCDKSDKPTDQNSGNGGGIVENENLLVKLNRTIYLVGEQLDIESVQKMSSLGYFVPAGAYHYDTDFSETAGQKHVLFNVGTEQITVTVDVYETSEDAAKANSIYVENGDNSQYFDESDVIDVEKKKLKKDTILGEDANGKPMLRSFTGYKTALALNQEKGTKIDVWTAEETNKAKSVLDPTRYSVPHTRSGKTDGANDDPAKYLSGGYQTSRWKTEFIFDSEGKLAYFANCIPDNTWKHVGHLHTTKWYSHSSYANDEDNPALIIKKDADEVNKYKEEGWQIIHFDESEATDAYPGDYIYEKVIPEGGFYVYMDNATANDVFHWLSGTDLDIQGETEEETDANLPQIFTQENRIKTTLNESRGFFDGKKMKFYAPSTAQQQYAYYYLEVLNGDPAKFAEALAFKDEVYKTIVEASNPKIATEPVLADFYDGAVEEIIAEWAEMINAIN